MTFDEFYNHCGHFRHFKSHEWLTKGGSNSNRRSRAFALNTDPPFELWQNAAALFKLVDKIRDAAGCRIILASVYRSPLYNRAVGGEKASYHMQFKAADLVPVGISAAKLHAICERLRDGGLWKGGLGKYPTFVHVDVRGRNADW